ncbi:hypothetical protein [Ensifer sp. 4252]|uniref:hypothetical protein n=1 Tax=Ensifer sp. 4252 TaxID=3373915 RepID=UPI003D235547
MSDEGGATKRPEGGIVEHLCEHPGCKKWGSLGYAVGRALPNWYCFEHKIEWPPAEKFQGILLPPRGRAT